MAGINHKGSCLYCETECIECNERRKYKERHDSPNMIPMPRDLVLSACNTYCLDDNIKFQMISWVKKHDARSGF